MGRIIGMALACIGLAFALPAHAHADYLFNVCPSGQSGVASLVTSCPFADNVRQSWYLYPGTVQNVYSPVTGGVYTMYCYGGQSVTFASGIRRIAVRCDGGNEAAVVFW